MGEGRIDETEPSKKKTLQITNLSLKIGTGLIPVKLLHHMEDFARAPVDSYG
jgi:hypothetical protein